MSDHIDLLSISAELGKQLKQRHATISTAESCTGGWIAKAITDVEGSSAWFNAGLVTYSEQMKQRLLNVNSKTLLQAGVVSEDVANEMAVGACQSAGSDYAISVTGLAGPGGGSDELPVGTVCFGFADSKRNVTTYQQHFLGDREQVRHQAVQFALQTALSVFFKN